MYEQTVACSHIQQTQSNIIIHSESSLCPPDKCKSNIYAHLSSGLVSWVKYLALMLLNVHQLVANYVCLLVTVGTRQWSSAELRGAAESGDNSSPLIYT